MDVRRTARMERGLELGLRGIGNIAVVLGILAIERPITGAVWLFDTTGGQTAISSWIVALIVSALAFGVIAVGLRVAGLEPILRPAAQLGLAVGVLVPVVIAEDQTHLVPVIAVALIVGLVLWVRLGSVRLPLVAVLALLSLHGVLAALSATSAGCSSAEDCYRSDGWSTAIGFGFLWLGCAGLLKTD